jgi:hypothetical protein
MLSFRANICRVKILRFTYLCTEKILKTFPPAQSTTPWGICLGKFGHNKTTPPPPPPPKSMPSRRPWIQTIPKQENADVWLICSTPKIYRVLFYVTLCKTDL